NYSVSRNNFFGSSPFRTDLFMANGTTPRNVPDRFPRTKDERFYEIAPCTINTVARPNVVDAANSCGSTFDERINPSNTGNIRGASRLTLGDQLTLTVDPSFQYVKANGGGTAVGQEGFRDIQPGSGVTNSIGYLGGSPYFGRDLNGDGDLRDSVRVLTPSQTRTDRYGLTSSLIYEINEDHTARVSYTYDRARHRQTGEVGFLDLAGRAVNVFPVNNPLADASGSILQKRDRLSYAILNQISGEYRGSFMDDRLDVNIGLRAPFFKRDLDNRCFTSSAGGFVECFGTNTAAATQYATLNPMVQGPREVTRKYDKLLPNLGLTFDVTNDVSLFANYAKGLSVPSTDNLYNAFFFAEGTEGSQPRPETTDTVDAGMRFTSRQVQAQFAGWFTKFKDRTASAFDPELNTSVFRNLGEVDKYGFDGSVAFQPVPEIVLYAFGSYLNSEIKDDVIIGETAAGVPLFGPTAGKRESGSPNYTFGGRAQAMLGPVELGVQAKRTGKRFVFDTNEPVFAFVNGAQVQVYGAAAPAYTLVDLDARLSLAPYGLERTYFQLNATNVFDKLYVGGFGGGLNQTINRNTAGTITGFGNPPFVQIGAPRTISGSVIIGF
ncbi:MAG: TonB-dependent receptor, partial [Pseudomonadota bacterium]|nr:TonB-dependent receptor [Pseudomonadota bacterium]